MSEDSDDPAGSETNRDPDKNGPSPRRPAAKKRPTKRRRRKNEDTSDFRTVFQTVLAEVVEAREDGKVKKISRQQAYLNADLRNALKGDAKATLRLLKKAQKYGLLTPPKHQNGSFLTEPTGEDGKIVRMFDAEQAAIKIAQEKGDIAMQKVAGLRLSKRR
jgi:hypothetical protein